MIKNIISKRLYGWPNLRYLKNRCKTAVKRNKYMRENSEKNLISLYNISLVFA